MAIFDYRAAREAGWDDQAIADFIAKENSKGADLYIPKEVYNAYQSDSGVAAAPAADGPVKSFVKDLYKGIVTPVVNAIARPGQAVAHAANIGKLMLHQAAPDKFAMPEEKYFSGEVPIGFGMTAHVSDPAEDLKRGETPGKVLEKTAGQAAQTVALGLGPVSGGAAFMGGAAMERQADAPEVLTHAGFGAAGGKVLDMGLRVFGKALAGVGDNLLQPFKSSFRADIAKTAAERGLTLPVSAMSNSKMVRALEATAKGGPFGAQIENTVNAARKSILGMVTNLKKNINLDATIDTTKDPVTVGNLIKKSFDGAEDVYRETRTKLYEAVTPTIKDIPADVTTTRAVLQDIIAQKSQSLEPGAAKQVKYYEAFLKKLGSDVEEFKKTATPEMREFLEKNMSSKDTLTFDALKQTRSDLGARLKGTDPVATGDRAQLNRVYAALSQDLDRTVEKHGPPEATEALKAANDYYKSGLRIFNSAMGRKISNSAKPELLVKQLVRPGEVTEINTLKETVSEDVFQDIQSAFVVDMLENAKGDAGEVGGKALTDAMDKYGKPTLEALLGKDGYAKLDKIRAQAVVNEIVTKSIHNGDVSAPKIAAQIKKFGNEQLQKWLDPQVYKDLTDAAKLSDAISFGQKVAEGSPTAEKTRILGYLTVALQSPLLLVKELVGEKALSRFLGSAFGRKYMTEGYGKIPGLGATGRAIAGVPGALRNVPRKAIPGTSAKEIKDAAAAARSDQRGFAAVPGKQKKSTDSAFGVNDRVKITDKATGQSQERVIRTVLPDGSGLAVMPPDGVGIPNKVDFKKWNIEVLEKGDPKAPQKRGPTFGELAKLEEREAKEFAGHIKDMKVNSLESISKKFDDTGSAIIAQGNGKRVVIKDEGDYVVVGMDSGGLMPTDEAAKMPRRVFSTKEGALDALKEALQAKKSLKGGASIGAVLGGGAVASTAALASMLMPKNEVEYKRAPEPEKPKADVDGMLEALAYNETGGVKEDPYKYRQFSGSDKFGDDLGKYQVTEAELTSYGEKFLGKKVTADEFVESPALQEKYMRAKLEFLIAEGLSEEGAIAMHSQGMSGWGDPETVKKKIADSNKYRRDYVNRALKRMKKEIE